MTDRLFAIAGRWSLLIVLLALVTTLAGSGRPLHAQSDHFDFGFGAGIQLIDPAGANQMPFWSGEERKAVSFRLYALTPAELAVRYAGYEPYGPRESVDLTGLTATHTWTADLAPMVDSGNYAPITLPAAASGVYAVEAVAPDLRATNLLVLSPYTLVAKEGVGDQFQIWAVTVQSGAPAAGMTVTLLDDGGNTVATAVTDGDGLARFDLDDAAAAPLFALGQTQDAVALVGLDSQWRAGGWNWWPEPDLPDRRVYLYTDRPIYRPGHTVQYGAVIRRVTAGGYAPVDSSIVFTATLHDARGNLVAETTTQADDFGLLDGAFSLSDEPPLGSYTLGLNDGSAITTRRFDVEAYTKPEYAVTVSTPAEHAIAGDEIPVTVAADYFFGRPVAGAAVKLRVYRTPLYGGWWWDWYLPTPIWSDGLVQELDGLLDENGRWQTTLTPEATADLDARYRLVATVTDPRGLPVEGAAGVTVHWNTFDLQVRTDRYGYPAGSPIGLAVTANDWAGAPMAGQDVTLRILTDDYATGQRTDAIPPRSLTTGADGTAAATVDSLDRGWYRVQVTGQDGRGRTVTGLHYLWIYGQEGAWWYTSGDDLNLLLDKESYAPGETARLLVESRVNGPALLTVEGASVHHERLITLDGPVTAVDLPVEAGWMPNVTVKLHLVKPVVAGDSAQRRAGQLVTGQADMTVSAESNRLAVDISADAERYEPGDTARLTVRLADSQGDPAAGRISVAVVDEAIFALREENNGAIFDAFYGRRAAGVRTFDGLVRNPYSYGYWDVGLEDGGAVPTSPSAPEADGPAQQSDEPAVRKNFQDTAYWNPSIPVGADGVVTVEIPLPDNLTTWRVLVRAVTQETRVGDGAANLLVSQDLIARADLPRFAVLGDQFQVGVLGQNYTGAPVDATFSLASDALTLLDAGPRTRTIPDGGGAAAHWTAVASTVGNGQVTGTLAGAAGGDALQLPFPVKPFAVPERETFAGQAAPQAVVEFDMPLNAQEEASDLTIRLAPSLALGVLDGLADLIDYPYGCVEQTMSRVLPAAVAVRAYGELGLPNPKATETPEIVAQGLQKLYGFQHNTGGWGWFYDDEESVYLTAYVLLGLHQIQEAGFTVDRAVLERGFAHLESGLDSAGDADILSFALYVKALAGRDDRPRIQTLLARQAELDPAGLAFLAMALHAQGDGAAGQVLDRLLAQATETERYLYWPVNRGEWDWHDWRTMPSTDKNSAVALQALLQIRPEEPRLSKTVRWLMEHRQGAGWSNTQATAFAVLSLTDYIRTAGELTAEYAYSIQLNGAEVASGQVTPANAAQPIPPVVVEGSRLQPGVNRVTITRSGDAGAAAVRGETPLYYSMLVRRALFYPSYTPVASADQGMSLRRSYALVEGAPRDDGAYNVGDVVEVTLELTLSHETAYVLVQDPIPAGFEPVTQRLGETGGYPFMAFDWWNWGFNRRDLRDDRVDFFITRGWTGAHRLTYQMRAVTPGIFSVPPGQAYPMYLESMWARTAGDQMTVADEQVAVRAALTGDLDRSCTITDFDVKLVAAAWGTDDPDRDLTGDGTVDLADLAAVGSRRGAACRADRPQPEPQAATVRLSSHMPAGNTEVGALVAVEIRSQGTPVGGFSMTLGFDPNLLRVDHVIWSESTGRIPLGPLVETQAGRVTVGGYTLAEPQAGRADAPLATVYFRAVGVGDVTVAGVGAQAVDSQGRELITQLTDGAGVIIAGSESFLPVVAQQ